MMPSGTKSSIENVLEHTCVEMEQTINQNVQNTLNKMEGDCKTITAKIDALMAKDNEGRAANFTAMTRGFALLSLALALVAAGLVPLLHHFDGIPTELQPHLSGALALIPAAANGTAATEAPAVRIGGGAFAAAFVLYVVSLFVRRYVPTFSRAEKLKLKETRAFVASELLDEQQRLFKQYLDECRSDKQ